VIKSSDSFYFTLKKTSRLLSCLRIGVWGGFTSDHLDGNLSINGYIGSQIDFTHAAAAEKFYEMVPTYMLSFQ
jgi:hypothetical protein